MVPQLCWDGNAAPSPQAAGGGHRVSLAWPRTELITGLVRRPSPKLETCPHSKVRLPASAPSNALRPGPGWEPGGPQACFSPSGAR